MFNSVSIIVTCEEQQLQLRQLLPWLLSLQHVGEYEVIVVDKTHDKDLAEWLEETEVHNPNLSHTFCPASSRGIDIQRLALTLGAKAANHEWLVIMPADTEFLGDHQLQKLWAGIGEGTDIVVGITNRKRRWNWLTSYLFRRRFSLFRPTSAIILCHRSILQKGQNLKLSKHQVVKLYKQ